MTPLEFHAKWEVTLPGKSFVYFTGPFAGNDPNGTVKVAWAMYWHGEAILTKHRLTRDEVSDYDYVVTKRTQPAVPTPAELAGEDRRADEPSVDNPA